MPLSESKFHAWIADVSALNQAERDELFAQVEALDPVLARVLRHETLGDEPPVDPTFFPGADEVAPSVDGATYFPEGELAPDDGATFFPGSAGPTLSPTTSGGADTGPIAPPRDDGERIGRYRILGKLGEGGMGVVYEAEQDRPRRKVAIKVIRATAAHMRRRFEWEAEVLARLDHPGIARILEAHADPQRSWFAMEYVDGPTLEHAVNGFSVEQIMGLVADIADAVHHAHLKGVVHRDLKPGNILVAQGGQPKVLDFGIARAMDEDDQPGHTRVGQIIGTPRYMSPEQATVGGDDLDGRSDVYALGVIAFELLAGRPPYEVAGKPLPEMVRIITETEAPLLSRLDRKLAGDVSVIVAKCLEKEPSQRYQSAWDLAEDLRRCLRDEPIIARPATATYQLSKFARRNRGLTATLLGLAWVLVVSAVLSTVLWRKAEQAGARTEAARLSLEKQADVLLLQQAQNELERDPTRTVAWLRRLGPDADYNRAYALILEAEALGVARHVLSGHSDEVRISAFSPDGRWIATGSYDDSVRVWDLETGEGRVLGSHGADVKFVGFRPDGRLWTASRDRTARIWDVMTGEYVALEGHGAKIDGAAVHPTRSWFVTGSDDGTAWLWDEQGKPIRNFSGHEGGVGSVAFSDDGRWLATGGTGGKVGIWDPATGEGGFIDVHEHDLRGMAFSPDGRLLVTTSRDGTVGVVEMTEEGPGAVRRLYGHQHEVRRVGFVANDRVVTGARDGELRVWDLTSGEGERLGQVGGVVRHLAVSPDRETVAVGSEDGVVWLLDMIGGGSRRLLHHADAVRHVAFSADGAWLVSSSSDGTARVWPVGARSPARLRGHTRRIMDLTFSADGAELATASSDYSVRMWELSTGRSTVVVMHDDEVEALAWADGQLVSVSRDMTLRMGETVLPGPERIDGLAVSPDGRWAAGAMRGSDLSIWNLETGELRGLRGHRSRVHTVAFSPDGRLASGGKDHTVRIWDVMAGTSELVVDLEAEVGVVAWGSDGQLAAASVEGRVFVDGQTLVVGSGVVSDLAWSEDGQLAVATEQSDLVVIRDGRVDRRLTGHAGAVTGVAWAGQILVSVGEDGELRLWRDGWSQAFLGSDNPLRAVAVSPDGRRVAAGGDEGVVYLWPTDPPRSAKQVRERLRAATSAVVRDDGVIATP